MSFLIIKSKIFFLKKLFTYIFELKKEKIKQKVFQKFDFRWKYLFYLFIIPFILGLDKTTTLRLKVWSTNRSIWSSMLPMSIYLWVPIWTGMYIYASYVYLSMNAYMDRYVYLCFLCLSIYECLHGQVCISMPPMSIYLWVPIWTGIEI